MVGAVVLTSAAGAQTLLPTSCRTGSDRLGRSSPVKAVRIIVPVARGGGTDPASAPAGQKIPGEHGQTFVIENRTGAGSMMVTEFVVRAAPEKQVHAPLRSVHARGRLHAAQGYSSFDLLKDLTPVGQISSAAQFLVVHSSVPVSSVKEFIAHREETGRKMNARRAAMEAPII